MSAPGRSTKPKKQARVAIVAAPARDHRTVLACRLDRNADVLLFLGCHVAAERLSLRAQALREAGR